MSSRKFGGFEHLMVATAEQARSRGYRMAVQYEEPPESQRYRDALTRAGATLVLERLRQGRLSGAGHAVRLLIRRRPAIVHLHFANASTRLAVGVLAHALGVERTVATVHYLPSYPSGGLGLMSYACLDRVLCVSRAVEERLRRSGLRGSGVSTLYLGVPQSDIYPHSVVQDLRGSLGIPRDARVATSIVFDSPNKGVDTLLSAFAEHLFDRYPDLHLIVVGIPEAASRHHAARIARFSERVHWAGIRDEVGGYLAASDVYVQPSRSEAFGLAMVEAAGQGLPVVATDVGGIPEIVADGESGLLVPPDSPEALASAVGRLLDDPGLAARLGESGRERCRERFGLERAVEELMLVYDA